MLHSSGCWEDMVWQLACQSLAWEPAQGKELDEVWKGQAAPVDEEHINLSTAAGELFGLQNIVIKGQPGGSANAGSRLPLGGQSEEWVTGRPTGEWRRGEEGQALCPELAAGGVAHSSWLCESRMKWPGWDCLGGDLLGDWTGGRCWTKRLL